MIYLESESDGKTKVSEATLSETPMIYLESESDGKTKAFETTLCDLDRSLLTAMKRVYY